MLVPAKEEGIKFSSYEALKDHVEEDRRTAVERLNFTSGDQIKVNDDRYLVHQNGTDGTESTYEFTSSALKKLFTVTGCGPLYNSMMLESGFGMSTSYINDILSPARPYLKKLNGYNFIHKDGVILGFFSQKYTYVQNADVLAAANDHMGLEYGGSEFKFDSATLVNTKMKVRVVQEYTGFKLRKGKDDITQLGLELKNSHIGDTALNVDIFVKRLVCNNGMLMKSSKMNSRVIHKGDTGGRIGDILGEAKYGYIDIKNRIETLIDIPYILSNDPANVDRTKTTARLLLENQAPIKVLPDMSETGWYNPHKKYKDDFIKTQALNACANNLDNIPHKYPGVCSNIFNSKWKKDDERSLYDWTEIFTERANHESYSITEKENIQEATGNLVSWIAKKKKILGFTGDNI